jgi:hypothetical protein
MGEENWLMHLAQLGISLRIDKASASRSKLRDRAKLYVRRGRPPFQACDVMQ